jgi:glycosyltransferase involved in cell wall biosynthesis
MKLLCVASSDNLAVAHWINHVSAVTDWDIHLFSCLESEAPRPELRHVTLYGKACPSDLQHETVRCRGRLWPLPRGANRLLPLVRMIRPGFGERSEWLKRMVRWIQPDIVHSIGLTEAGPLTAQAKLLAGNKFPPWIATNWGSSLPLFDPTSGEFREASAALASANYLLCQTQMDSSYAISVGFRGKLLPICPQGGGVDTELCSTLRKDGPASQRKVILVDGFPDWPGRALVALRAIERVAHKLEGFCVGIWRPSYEVELKAELLFQDTGIPVHLLGDPSYEQILKRLGAARILIALHVSPAVSPLFHSALALGVLPIESHMSCADQWIVDGRTGFLVPPEDPGPVGEAILRAAMDDRLVDASARENATVAAERLDSRSLGPYIIAMYKQVAAEGRSTQNRAQAGRSLI